MKNPCSTIVLIFLYRNSNLFLLFIEQQTCIYVWQHNPLINNISAYIYLIIYILVSADICKTCFQHLPGVEFKGMAGRFEQFLYIMHFCISISRCLDSLSYGPELINICSVVWCLQLITFLNIVLLYLLGKSSVHTIQLHACR